MLFYFLAGSVLAVDRLTKLLALHYLSLHESVPVLPGIFHFSLVKNQGIAFGMFQNGGLILFALISVSLVILIVLGMRLEKEAWLERVSFALILGGAVGNWVDRMRYGAVIDFLDFRVWPVFNIADSAISIGVGLYLWSVFFIRKGPKNKES